MSGTTMCAASTKLDTPGTPAGGLRVTSRPIPRVIAEHAVFFTIPKVSNRQPAFVCLDDSHRFRTSHVPDSNDAFLGSNRKLHTVV